MGVLIAPGPYETLRTRVDDDICFLQIHRPESGNTINDTLIREFGEALSHCRGSAKIVVVEGLPEVFCFGADFRSLEESEGGYRRQGEDPGPLYDAWRQLAEGDFLTIAHVRGKANAGGVGFAAACDVVLCEQKAVFSLSELLFGLMPACVLPFLMRRIGSARAKYLTLMTQPIPASMALEWGLADACEENSENLLRKHLLRLRRLDRTAVLRLKRYLGALDGSLAAARPKAIAANVEVFSDRSNLEKISRYVRTGQFPWDAA
jgi:polyketide biosynthesis enoyl-CoA hydratase PksH